MLRNVFISTLFVLSVVLTSQAQSSSDSVYTHGSVDQIIEFLEENYERYADTESLKRQLAGLKEQPRDYINNLAVEYSKRVNKFEQGYVSDATRTLLNRSKQNYDAGDNLKAVEFYVVADFMRRKEYLATEDLLKSMIDKAEKQYNKRNYTEAQVFIDQADEIIAANPVFVNSTVMEDYIIDFESVRKKNNWKLTDGYSSSFKSMSGKFILKAKALYGVGRTGTSDITMKHRPYGHRNTNVSHTFTFKNAEMSDEYGIGLVLQYQVMPSALIYVSGSLWPMIKTTGMVEYEDAWMGEAKYSFRTFLVNVSFGATAYLYRSDMVRLYGSAGGGFVHGTMNEQDEIPNKFQFEYARYGDLYHKEDSYVQPMASVSFGIDYLPFANRSYLNSEVQFGKYFDIQEAAPESLFSLSLGTGVYF